MLEELQLKGKNLVGETFGKLTVLEFAGRDKNLKYMWMCVCACGGPNAVKIIRGADLVSNKVKSCRKCNSFYEHPDGYMVGVTAKGQEFFFDKEDYELVKQYTWRISSHGYVITNTSRRQVFFHRLVLNTPDDLYTDHVDGNRVDNRKINLRVCTTQENLRNKSPKVNRLNSKYKGVYYTDACGSKHWVTCIRCNYKQIHIGYYHSQEEAALAYNEKAKELFGEFARLNEVIVC